ncbi:hypothetical protein O6H91_01G088000 [Diphasiastrum complanatum]|uniref:Uncharacterized protein n=1 Tax=Diphasiastrum complanatum TaxID=34168 RepID=A0ACC2ETI3_DIPCM|nr:hypothetical protein O6H91_01G088000 [Diphasiastrum complanatum]
MWAGLPKGKRETCHDIERASLLCLCMILAAVGACVRSAISSPFPSESPNSLMDQLFSRYSAHSHSSLIENLKSSGTIMSKRVADVMEKLDRALFTPQGEMPYLDSPLPIGYNATISAPHMHATCLELLENYLQQGMRALDIGSGTGYLTAAFALMVGEHGRVVGVEHIAELVNQSLENIKCSEAAPLLESGCLSFHVADGRSGWPDEAPYESIHVGAAASKVPQSLIDQLKPGGRMVIPVGNFFQDLLVIDKQLDGTLKQWTTTSVRYVPLTSRESQLASN